MGKFDTTALVDKVLQLTGQKKIAYVGYSQGTTQMFSALSENQGNLNSKISVFIALAPVATLGHGVPEDKD